MCFDASSAEANPRQLNDQPIASTTDLVDPLTEGERPLIPVRARFEGSTLDESSPVAVAEAAETGGFRRIKLQGNTPRKRLGSAISTGRPLDYLVNSRLQQ